MYRIFVINPGSTSTKISLFEDEKSVWEKKIFHEASDLAAFACINDQLDFRFDMIEAALKAAGIDLNGIDAIVGRGGSSATVESGVYEINALLVKDTREIKGGIEHASMLGVQLAKRFCELYGGLMLMVDPIVVDEYCDLARMTGIKGVYRTPSTHSLNQRGVAMKYAREQGKKYEELNLIVAHIDGGITIGAHEHGKMIDCNSGAGGDGPYTPSRIGSVGIVDFIKYAEGKDLSELKHLCNIGGGLSSLLSTNDADEVMNRIAAGDAAAKRAWDAMIYQICKCIGSMACVLSGNVDVILLTGGLMRFDYITEVITRRCGFIAPIKVYLGEVEQEAMSAGAIRVLSGKEKPKQYTGKPVFEGFEE